MTGRFSSWISTLLTRERELPMIWEVRKDGKQSYLAGAAHFFPYHFRRSLRRYLDRVETVLLEGPLDEKARRKVVESGSARGTDLTLGDVLRPETVVKINSDLRAPTPAFGMHPLSREVFNLRPADFLGVEVSGLKPWMAFFQIWNHYLGQNGWTHKVELDVLQATADLDKRMHFLETIEEQISALEGVPVPRIVSFLDAVDWTTYRRDYARSYLKGRLDALIETARVFPTFCAPVLEQRDPVLHARMHPHLAAGNAIAFVGILHCPRIISLLRAEGFKVEPVPGNG